MILYGSPLYNAEDYNGGPADVKINGITFTPS